MVLLREESAADLPAIEALLDMAFGPDRLNKISYRYRDGIQPIGALSLVAVDDADRLVGTIRYWPISLAGNAVEALLLGPIAVEPSLARRGVGRALIFTSLEKARTMGIEAVFLVGNPGYYGRFGFSVAPRRVLMPGEQPERLQYRLLGIEHLPAGNFVLEPCPTPTNLRAAAATC